MKIMIMMDHMTCWRWNLHMFFEIKTWEEPLLCGRWQKALYSLKFSQLKASNIFVMWSRTPIHKKIRDSDNCYTANND